MLDGANDLKILLRIIMPISTPLLATMAIFVAVGQWNAWFDAAFFVKQEELKTLGYRLMEVINQAAVPTGQENIERSLASARVTPLSVRVAAMMVAVFPILCIYPFLQRYFISGLTIGSVKG
jgi:putative aldouronate transport system permease protein